MKEAAGEANMTVITIVLIAIVLGVGTVVVTSLMKNTQRKSGCANLGGTMVGNVCCKNPTVDANGVPTGCSSSYSDEEIKKAS